MRLNHRYQPKGRDTDKPTGWIKRWLRRKLRRFIGRLPITEGSEVIDNCTRERLAVVHWRNPNTTAEGNGEPIEAGIADAWVRAMKEEWPEMHHSVVPLISADVSGEVEL